MYVVSAVYAQQFHVVLSHFILTGRHKSVKDSVLDNFQQYRITICVYAEPLSYKI